MTTLSTTLTCIFAFVLGSYIMWFFTHVEYVPGSSLDRFSRCWQYSQE